MVNDPVWFLWWVPTVLLCVWKLAEGLLRPRRMLEWPFLACAMWLYFYGYMAIQAKLTLSAYLSNDISHIGQLMPLLCLIGLLAGWSIGVNGKRSRSKPPRPVSTIRLWQAGIIFVLFGAAGCYSVAESIDTTGVDFQHDSGYWYLSFYVGYPGLAMAVWALARMEPGTRRWLCIGFTVLAVVAFMYPTVSHARRGPLFPTVMVLLLVPPLATRKAPNRLFFLGGMVFAALAMLFFLQIRSLTGSGYSWTGSLSHLSLSEAVEDRGERPEDNEYINSCQMIGTIFQNGKYQYGTGHMSLMWHWIPRAVWHNKPTLGEGSYSFEEMFDDVEMATGVRLLGAGAAAAGVADSFVQYGPFCPLFWFFLSWGMGAVYLRACDGVSLRWLFCYVGFICASHWLVSQALAAAFVPGMCFQAVPQVVLTALSFIPESKPAARRRPRMAMGHPARPTVQT